MERGRGPGGLPLEFEFGGRDGPQPGPTVPPGGWPDGELRVPIGVSARHVHLSAEHLEALFGRGYRLRLRNWISQPGQFAAEETVSLIGPRGTLEGVRVVGPVRSVSQVELSMGDARRLGISAPVRMSGDVEGSPGVVLRGPRGEVTLRAGVVVPARHIHAHPEDVIYLGLEGKEVVRVRAGDSRAVIFENVLIRVHPMFRFEMHIDTEEANAAGVTNGDWGKILID